MARRFSRCPPTFGSSVFKADGDCPLAVVEDCGFRSRRIVALLVVFKMGTDFWRSFGFSLAVLDF